MLKKTITYTNFNDETVTETFYFNLSKAELTKMELEHSTIKGEEVTGGFVEMSKRVVETGRGKDIMQLFEDILERSYGVRSEDGKRFHKSKEAYEDFKASGAYDALYYELVTNAEEAANFINKVVPSDISGDPELQKAIDRDKADPSRLMETLKARAEQNKSESVEPKPVSPEEDEDYQEWLRQRNSK